MLLKMAIEFAFSYSDWFWLAQELILQCINNTLTYGVTGRHQATSRFIYGKILYEKGNVHLIQIIRKIDKFIKLSKGLRKSRSRTKRSSPTITRQKLEYQTIPP